MTTPRLLTLLKNAGHSIGDFGDFLSEGLDWPLPVGVDWPEVLPEWDPESLKLDPDKVAALRRIYQLHLVTGQDVGVLVLEFDGTRLPVGAVRRVFDRFISAPRGRRGNGTIPEWDEDRILAFCVSTGDGAVHAVGVRRDGGKRVLRILSWGRDSTPARLELIASRGLAELRWGEHGPALTSDLGESTGFGAYRGTIRSVASLVARMAEVARDLRDEVRRLLEIETADGPMRQLVGDFRERLLPDLSDAKFADVYAQTMVYGLLSARVMHPELFKRASPLLGIRFSNELLDSIYARFREQSEDELDVDELGLGDLAAQLASTDVEGILADFGSKDRKMDPVVFLYEQFLQQYDSRQRMDAGAFYTPLPVVSFMTRAVDSILKTQFGLPLGIADQSSWSAVCRHLGIVLPDDVVGGRPFVSMVDPATGTGTFLTEWIRVARSSYESEHGTAGWAKHFAEHVAPAMHAFELMLAPYSVAHLKFAIEGHAAGVELDPTILLSDTLQHPAIEGTPELFSDGPEDPIAVEAQRADDIKALERFTVVIGNPPYNREQGTAAGELRSGGVVRHGVPGVPALMDSLTKPMRDAGQGIHIKNLYNDYAYFWRWATWRATEYLGAGPGIVSFITSASYLSGKSMSGLRAHLRTVFDDFYVVDLGGEGRGANIEPNVFDILTPVAIGLGVRRTAKPASCTVHYVKVSGSRDQKLDWLATDFADVDFDRISGSELDAFSPAATGDYASWPSIEEVMIRKVSGCQAKRTWPIASSPEILHRRWRALLAADDRGTALREAKDLTLESARLTLVGRKRSLATIATEPADADSQPIERYGYRSFDRQFVLADARLLTYPRNELWDSRSDHQIYFTTLTSTTLGQGPVLTATPYVPDLHHFKNRGAKDVFPLWRDSGTSEANLAPDLLVRLAEVLGEGIDAHAVVQYLYGLGGTAAFSARFGEELAVAAGPVRLPITKDRSIFDEVTELGSELLAWHTWGERYSKRPLAVGGSSVLRLVTGRPERYDYEASNRTLTIGDGAIAPVSAEVWNFEVSGMKPLQKWLGYRMAKRQGRTSSPLDEISYDEWTFTDELLLVISILQKTVDLTPRAAELLNRVLAGEIFTTDELT